MPKLLLATNNSGKVREYKKLLKDAGYELVTPAELGISADIEETGNSLAENATIKASAMAEASGILTLADDSGLFVDALNGAPGVHSARYAGENATDEQRMAYLLKKLTDVPQSKRTARFRCVIAITKADGKTELAEGECAGVITSEPTGKGGFGYDPVFYLPEIGKTMSEVSPQEKNRISHRAHATTAAIDILKRLL